jgi:hypothetical protein
MSGVIPPWRRLAEAASLIFNLFIGTGRSLSKRPGDRPARSFSVGDCGRASLRLARASRRAVRPCRVAAIRVILRAEAYGHKLSAWRRGLFDHKNTKRNTKATKIFRVFGIDFLSAL